MRMHFVGQRLCWLVLGVVSILVLSVPGTGAAWAGSPVNTGYFGNIAIQGYDPVAYFTDGRAVKGSDQFTYKWLGATWQFANAQHLQTFAATPIQYAPQYGGLCALGMVKGERSVDIDPEAWRIVDGKLYLFFGKGGLEQDWDPNPEAVVAKADANWPAVEAKLVAR
jgi:YHS domain-containing protein